MWKKLKHNQFLLLWRNAKCHYYKEKSFHYQIYYCLKEKPSFHQKIFQKEKNKLLLWIYATFKSFVVQWLVKIAGHQSWLKPLRSLSPHLFSFPVLDGGTASPLLSLFSFYFSLCYTSFQFKFLIFFFPPYLSSMMRLKMSMCFLTLFINFFILLFHQGSNSLFLYPQALRLIIFPT